MIIGLDVGGTNIDAVIIKDNAIIKVMKSIVDHSNLYESIWTVLKELIKGHDKSLIKKINLSTTISTNAIVEGNISNVGMIIQSGPGLPNSHLEIGHSKVFIKGYTDHRGIIVEEVDNDEINKGISMLKDKGINDIAIVSKFSVRNPKTENQIAELSNKHFNNITLGHKMSGRLNFPRRVNTAYLNAAVNETFKNFAGNIKASLKSEGINASVAVLKADGGVMSIYYAIKMPVETILSGPAASLMGINALLPNLDDAILLDIGGTTTDIFLQTKGVSLFEPAGIKIDKYNTLVRAIFSKSIGLGGDSSVKVIDSIIKIGPKRLDKPAALGGHIATPTDAMVVLRQLDLGDKELARLSIAPLANELNLSIENTATKILDVMATVIKDNIDELLLEVNNKPVYTIKEILLAEKLIPKKINIIGGPAKVLAPLLRDKFNLSVHYPKNFEVANAIGAALAKPTTAINLHANTATGILVVSELGIYENINKNFSMEDAKRRALELLTIKALELGANKDYLELEITEATVFNMVDGFYTKGQNIRIQAQVKPGLINGKVCVNNA